MSKTLPRLTRIAGEVLTGAAVGVLWLAIPFLLSLGGAK